MSTFRGFGIRRVLAAAVLSVTCGTLVLAQQKPAPKDAKADAAMSGQQAPAEFPIQFQNDFLRAQGNRVWVPITLTIDPAKLTTSALTIYLRVVPRGMTAPPAPAAAAAAAPTDKDKKDKDKDKKKDPKNATAAPPAPS